MSLVSPQMQCSILWIAFSSSSFRGVVRSGEGAGKLSMLGPPAKVGQEPTVLAVGAGGSCLDIQ